MSRFLKFSRFFEVVRAGTCVFICIVYAHAKRYNIIHNNNNNIIYYRTIIYCAAHTSMIYYFAARSSRRRENILCSSFRMNYYYYNVKFNVTQLCADSPRTTTFDLSSTIYYYFFVRPV